MERRPPRCHDHAMTTEMNTPRSSEPPRGVGPLIRPTSGRVIAGVASGLARRYDIGVGWIRLGFVVAAFFGGFGVLAYLVGWLVIPEEGHADSLASRYLARLDKASSWVGIALIGLAALIILGGTGLVRGELIWAAALLLVGILLYRGDLNGALRRDTPSDQAGAPTDSPEAGDIDQAAGTGPRAPVVEPPPPPPPPAAMASPTPVPVRPISYLGRFTVATVLIVVGVMALLDNTGATDPNSAHYAGAVIGIVGVGLLVGAWYGRARGLVALGIVSLPFVAFFSLVDIPFGAEWGDAFERPTAVSEVPDEYRLAVGQYRIDLSDLELGAEPLFVDVRVGVGDVTIIVPADTAVDARAEVGAGSVDLFGAVESGLFIDHSRAVAGDGFIDLDINLGAGDLTVFEARN